MSLLVNTLRATPLAAAERLQLHPWAIVVIEGAPHP